MRLLRESVAGEGTSSWYSIPAFAVPPNEQACDRAELTGLGFVATIESLCGPVAQLGARLNGIQEVTGSIPVRSTKPSFPVSISRK